MAKPDLSLPKQNLVDALKALKNKFVAEDKTLTEKLDNIHHAFVMHEWGERKELRECLEEIQKLILIYDTSTVTVTLDMNSCTGTAPTIDPQIPGSKMTLPSRSGMVPPEGKKLFGWNSKKDGSGDTFKFSEIVTVPDKNVTYYAWLGPDPEYVPPES